MQLLKDCAFLALQLLNVALFCGGNSAKARVSIVINAHGTTKARFAA